MAARALLHGRQLGAQRHPPRARLGGHAVHMPYPCSGSTSSPSTTAAWSPPARCPTSSRSSADTVGGEPARRAASSSVTGWCATATSVARRRDGRPPRRGRRGRPDRPGARLPRVDGERSGVAYRPGAGLLGLRGRRAVHLARRLSPYGAPGRIVPADTFDRLTAFAGTRPPPGRGVGARRSGDRVWTWTGPRPGSWVVRRMAHELRASHRRRSTAAVPRPTARPRDSGRWSRRVPHLVRRAHPRQTRLHRPARSTCTAPTRPGNGPSPSPPTSTVRREHAKGDAALRGPARTTC